MKRLVTLFLVSMPLFAVSRGGDVVFVKAIGELGNEGASLTCKIYRNNPFYKENAEKISKAIAGAQKAEIAIKTYVKANIPSEEIYALAPGANDVPVKVLLLEDYGNQQTRVGADAEYLRQTIDELCTK